MILQIVTSALIGNFHIYILTLGMYVNKIKWDFDGYSIETKLLILIEEDQRTNFMTWLKYMFHMFWKYKWMKLIIK